MNSNVVRVRHDGDDPAGAKEVEVTYVQKGQLYTVKALHCILACWHSVIPYLTTELPAVQVAALRSAEKVPIVYTNVALKNWESFVRLQTAGIYAPVLTSPKSVSTTASTLVTTTALKDQTSRLCSA